MSGDNKVQVEFGASTEGVEKGSTTAAQAIEGAVERMKSAMGGAGTSVQGMHGQFATAFEGMKTSVTGFLGHFGGIGTAVAAVTAVLAGGALFKGAVDETMKFAGESAKLARQLGITATEAGVWNIALGDVYLSAEEAGTAAAGLARQVRTNEAALKDMGLVTREANGELRPTTDLLRDAGRMVGTYREGMDRTIATTQLFGKGVSDSGIAAKLAAVDIEAAREKAAALGLTITAENVAANKALKASMNDVGDVMLGIKKTIGDALIPILARLGEWFANIGPAAVWVTKEAIGFLGTAFWSLKNGVVIVWETINAMVISVAEPIMTVGRALAKLVKGDLTGAADEMRSLPARIAQAWETAGDRMTESSRDTADKINNLFGEGSAAVKGAGGGKTATTKEGADAKGAAGKDDPSLMGAFKEGLQARREANEDFFKDSTAAEKAYWQDVKDSGALSVKDQRAVNTELFNLTKKLAQDQYAEKVAGIDGERSLGREKLNVKIEEVNALRAAGKVGDMEALAQIKAFHDADYAEEVKALNAKLALAGTVGAARVKLMNDVAAAEQRNNVTAIKDAAATASTIQRSWVNAFAPITSAFDTAVKGVISGTTTIKSAVTNMAKSIVLEYASMGVKTLASWAANEAAKTGATAAGTAARMALEGAAAIQSVALSAWAAIKNIMNYAWEAMAGAYKAIVGIPYVGPFLAPVAAGVAFAGVAGAVSSIASARGGYDIPAGVNPMTQLHEREMVLPAPIADPMRQMLAGGGSGGTDTLHWHGTPDDTIKAKDLGKILRKMNRNFEFVGA